MNVNRLSILYVGPADQGTCRSRRNALETLGYTIEVVDIFKHFRVFPSLSFSAYARFLWGPATSAFNRALLRTAAERRFDWVWVDKGMFLYPSTVKALRDEGLFLVHHLTDDFLNPRQWLSYRYYKKAIPDYHVHLTSNIFNVEELTSFGAQRVIRTALGFDPGLCWENGRPPQPNAAYKSDASFVGFWRDHLDAYLVPLVRKGLKLGLWGTRWVLSPHRSQYKRMGELRPVSDEEYRAIYASARIGLCFLNHQNRNTSTGRSFEIPAIGTMMLAERTEEHLSLYEEGKEAEFFDSPQELLDKALYYLTNDQERKRIAAAGHRRAITSGYRYVDRIRSDLKAIIPIYSVFRMGANLSSSSINMCKGQEARP